MPLSRLEMRDEMAKDYAELLPEAPRDELRRIRGVQEIIVRFEPEKALETLPTLLSDANDRARMIKLFQAVVNDPRIRRQGFTVGQELAIGRIRRVLGAGPMALP